MSKVKSFWLILAAMSVIAIMFAGCTAQPHQLSTSVVPTAGGTISPSAGTFKGEVTLVANAAQYYKFVGWAGDASGNTNPLTVKMNSDKQIVAQFSKLTYTVQVTSNPSDGGTVRPDSGTYEAGNMLTVTATPATRYRFVQWGTDASGSTNPLRILVDNNKVITANFVKQYTLVVSGNPTSAGTVSPTSGLYDANAIVNLTATPSFPYAFENWVGTDNNNLNPTSVTMNGDKSVSVNFVQLTKKTETPIQKSGNTYGIATIPIALNQSEWVEGTIDCDAALPAQEVYIQGPDGQKIKDLGRPGHASFQFQVPVAGIYTAVVKANYISTWGTNYNLTYTIYGRQ